MKAVKLSDVKVGDIIFDMRKKTKLRTELGVVKIQDNRVYLKHISGERGYTEDENGLIPFSIFEQENFYKP